MDAASAGSGRHDADPDDGPPVEVAQPDRRERQADRDHDRQHGRRRDERPRPDPVEVLPSGDERWRCDGGRRSGPGRPPPALTMSPPAPGVAGAIAGARSSSSPGRTPTRSMKISSSDGSAISNRVDALATVEDGLEDRLRIDLARHRQLDVVGAGSGHPDAREGVEPAPAGRVHRLARRHRARSGRPVGRRRA